MSHCQGHPSNKCICEHGDPCDYHAATCITCAAPSHHQDMAFLLDCFQASENHGRGMECVRSIVAYLYKGDITSASSVRRIEGDKTRIHTNVELLLEMIFGCRIHLEHDCDTWICTRTSPKNREALC